MPGGGNGQKLGDTFDNAEDDGVEKTHDETLFRCIKTVAHIIEKKRCGFNIRWVVSKDFKICLRFWYAMLKKGEYDFFTTEGV